MKFTSIAVSLCLAIKASCYTSNYAPVNSTCPTNKDLVRIASNISSDEADWIEQRHLVTDQNLINFLNQAGMEDFDAEDFINNQANRSIGIGIAFSGGGYRAMLSGAGQLSALDNRTTNASEAGLGGLLQCASYLVGLSGGNWLVGTVALNNFSSVESIIKEGVIWNLEHSILNIGGYNVLETVQYYDHISDDVQAKEDSGFQVSLTDVWGRALSHQFFAGLSDYGSSLKWSSLQDMHAFVEHEMPYPIVVTDGRTPGSVIISENSTIFEVNPYEIGSWDPLVYQFAQVKYLGTDMENGSPASNSCVTGFDNAGFVMGTSSSLFNQGILKLNTTSLSTTIKDLISHFLEKASSDEKDIAVYEPNPFYKTDVGLPSSVLKNETLYLCDGGEDLQNIPLYPLLQPERKVDIIFAYDNSADTETNWPNGTSMIATFERQFVKQGNGTLFPYVPDAESMINLNLTSRPTFFGCDAHNLSSLVDQTSSPQSIFEIPLVVYTANRPFSYYSNTSTFDLDYKDYERDGMIKNGFEIASRLNHTLDDEWAACVGCAIIRREQERQGLNQTEQCQKCFQKYCWDGSIHDGAVGVNFTLTGSTNGQESTGNTSSASSLLNGGKRTEFYQLISIAFITTLFFTLSF